MTDGCRVAVFVCAAAAACSGAVKVTCLGNSITAGPYPTFLQWDIGGVFEVQNAGVGATTLCYNGENPWIASGMLDTVVTFGPDIVYVMLGTNDSKVETWTTHSGEFAGDYCRLVDTLRALCPGVRVRACLPTPAWANTGGIRGDVIESGVIPAIQQAAQMRGIPVVDLHTPFVSRSELFPDGFHPSEAGAWEIARLVAAQLRTEYAVAPDLVPGGTVSSSGASMIEYADQYAVDNNPFSAWVSLNSGEKWFQVTFAQPTTVDRWEIVHAWNQQPSRITRDFVLQRSDNGSTWTDVDPVAGNIDPWTSRAVTPVSARYFRVYVTYGSMFGSAWFAGFALRNTGGTVQAAPQPVRSAVSAAQRNMPAPGLVDATGRVVPAGGVSGLAVGEQGVRVRAER